MRPGSNPGLAALVGWSTPSYLSHTIDCTRSAGSERTQVFAGSRVRTRSHGGKEEREAKPSRSAFRGTKDARPCDTPVAETRRLRLIGKRPSDRRSPGKNPGPQSAFEVSMINVSCNSHYFSQLAAFFIDA